MPFDSIKQISEAEERAEQIKTDAVIKGKEAMAAAVESGKKAMEDAKAKAAEELKELQVKADAKAKTQMDELSSTLENRKAALQARADDRFDQAVELVVERIVKS